MGAALGFTPRDIDGMSLAEIFACAEGWGRVHGAPQQPEAPSDEDHQKMRERYRDG